MSAPVRYQPPVFSVPVDLDLSRNEGQPWSLLDSGLDEELTELANRYPDTSRLRALVAGKHRVDPDLVLVTAGGDDALARCFQAFRGSRVVATSPSFEMIARYAGQNGCVLRQVGWWEGDFPTDGFVASDADVGIVVSPNNPTGSVMTQAELRRISAALSLVILDAAYTEFASEDLTDVALSLGNVVVIRTLSKAYGLAGLRVGYLVGPAQTIETISAFGSPYPVSGVSSRLGEAALGRNQGEMLKFVDEVVDERVRLAEMLGRLGAAPLASHANFVLATHVDPGWVVPAAASLGVGLREFPNDPELSRCVRISCPGDPGQFDRLAATLLTVLAPQALIFDLDGVLADVSGSYDRAIIETAASFGVTITPTDIEAGRAAGNANDDWELTRRLCLPAGVRVSRKRIKARFDRLYQGTEATPGLRETERPLVDPGRLRDWSRRLPLAIVTGRPRAEADEFLERFDLARYFEVVITRDDAPLKPDPAPVRLALKRLGVDRAWMAGDTVDDLDAATAAGVVPIGVVPPGADRALVSTVLGRAAMVLDSIDQLEEVLVAQDI